MSSIGSVTVLLHQLKDGEREAVRPLWEGYYRRLISLARARLRGAPRGIADEEDVALSAFDSFCRAAEAGRFPRLDDRDDLWQVLLMLTSRKAIDLREREGCEKRGGGRIVHASALAAHDDSSPGPLEIEAGPDAAEVAEVTEECQRLLVLLGDEQLTLIAVWKMEGYTNEEIATKIDRSVGAVERKLHLIRKLWEQELVRSP